MQKFIAGTSINLRDITLDDVEFVFALRSDAKKSRHIHAISQDIEEQYSYVRRYLTKSNEWYFIIEAKDGEQLGTVRIYDIKGDSFCWGSWIIKDGAPMKTALESALLVYEYGFYTAGFSKVHFDVRKENVRVQKFHESMGAWKTGETDDSILYEYSRDKYETIKSRFLRLIQR